MNRSSNGLQIAVVLFWLALGLTAPLAIGRERPVRIAGVRSGRAQLVQKGRLTILEISQSKGPVQSVALTHSSDYEQGTNAPFEARLIAESPQHFLIFTDTFDSNPGNVQGQCGASPTGERFVHVVALGTIPHETLSTLVDSCLLDLEGARESPEWVDKPDSAGFVGQLIVRFQGGRQPTVIYYVASDGSVTRPETKPNP